jgi:hypothetical protein
MFDFTDENRPAMRERDESDRLNGQAESGSNVICAARGLTVRDVALRYRVGEDKVRRWIKAGELAAINTAATLCGKPRYVVTVEAIKRFDARRTVCPPPKTERRRRQSGVTDYYPD